MRADLAPKRLAFPHDIFQGRTIKLPDQPAFSSGREEPVGQWVGTSGAVQEARQHRLELEAAIEAPGEAGEIAGGMGRAELAVGADDRRLDVAERGVDPLEWCQLRGLPTRAGDHRLMRAAGPGHRGPA